jgi:hypothetical protein
VRVTVRSRDAGQPAAFGVTLGSTVFVASYALQRLWAAWSGDEDWARYVVQYETPYYWRSGFALLHATVAGTIAGLGTRADLAATALRFAPLWVPAVVLPLALSMAVIP